MPTIFSHGWLSMSHEDNGSVYVSCVDGAACVAITSEGNVLLAKEPSPLPHIDFTYVLPGGAIDDGESPELAANRELQEEVGFKAGRLDKLHSFQLWKYLSANLHVFIARDLTESHLEGDEQYPIETVVLPLASIENQISAGIIVDASTIAALYMARTFLENEVKKIG